MSELSKVAKAIDAKADKRLRAAIDELLPPKALEKSYEDGTYPGKRILRGQYSNTPMKISDGKGNIAQGQVGISTLYQKLRDALFEENREDWRKHEADEFLAKVDQLTSLD